MGVFALWSLPVLVIAPLFSRDAYSYAAQGEMVSHHMNPYLYGPFELGNNSYTAPVDPLWGNAPAPYGPMFLQVDGFFARITFHNELATIVLLRLLALVGVLLIAACVPRLAKLYHRDGAELFTLMVLNPVTIFHLIGGAHNDALMLGLLVAGLTLAKEKRPIVGHPAVRPGHRGQGPGGPGHPLHRLELAGHRGADPGPGPAGGDRRADRGRRARVLLLRQRARAGAGSSILGTPGVVRSWASPTTGVAFLVTGVAHLAHVDVGVGRRAAVRRFLGLVGRRGGRRVAAAQQRPDRHPQGARPDPAALRAARPGRPALVPVVGADPPGPGGPRPAPLAGHRPVDGDGLHRAARRDPAGDHPAPRRPAADRADPAVDAGRPDRAAVLVGPRAGRPSAAASAGRAAPPEPARRTA